MIHTEKDIIPGIIFTNGISKYEIFKENNKLLCGLLGYNNKISSINWNIDKDYLINFKSGEFRIIFYPKVFLQSSYKRLLNLFKYDI